MSNELERLLGAVGTEPPEPSLLGWLAAHCSPSELPRVAELAAVAGRMRPHTGWPVIGDAVRQRVASRRDGVPFLAPDAPAPASLDEGLARLALPRGTPLYELTDQEVVYLLPFLPGSVRRDLGPRVVTAVEAAARAEAGWYATALAARAAPCLDGASRAGVSSVADRLGPRWGRRLAELARRRAPWPSAAAELDASHASLPDADHVAARLGRDVVRSACRQAVSRLEERLGTAGPVPPVRGAPWVVEEEDLDTGEALSPWMADEDSSFRAADDDAGALGRPGPFDDPGRPGPLGAPGRLSRHISTGVATTAAPELPLPAGRCLEPAADYLFWFEIGARPAAGSIEQNPDPVELPAGELTVMLFPFQGHIEIQAGRDIGRLLLRQDGAAVVRSRPAGTPAAGSRLFFPIRTPDEPGRYRMRCHLYHDRTLLQSRLVEMEVAEGARVRTHALTTRVDYTSGTALDLHALADLRPLTLSVFVNDNGDGTHAFRFWGDGDVKGQAVLGEGALQSHIDHARGALRRVSWGDSGADTCGPPFRYDAGPPHDWTEDLIDLACSGYRLWVSIGGEFAESSLPPARTAPVRQLADRLRAPGVIEIANKVGARMVVPAALFYDQPLDSGLDLSFCPDALAALRDGADPLSTPCFQGDCPWYDDRAVVCPSGFWGYRHEIGLPQSIAPVLDDASLVPSHGAPCIPCADRPSCVIGIAEEFAGGHTATMRERYLGRIYTDREELLAELRGSTASQLVYFYCHGDLDRGMPVLLIGDAAAPAISYEQIADDMYWPDSRPLVFLNGCRTAAVEPRHALTFVDAFVRRARASGLIGTEIITYESLAAEFAEAVLAHFIEGRTSIAYAMRAARLALLAQGNPLGLIYVAYAPPHLRLRKV
ncbi:hypothetical protein [Streptomyces sp. NPDC003374]